MSGVDANAVNALVSSGLSIVSNEIKLLQKGETKALAQNVISGAECLLSGDIEGAVQQGKEAVNNAASLLTSEETMEILQQGVNMCAAGAQILSSMSGESTSDTQSSYDSSGDPYGQGTTQSADSQELSYIDQDAYQNAMSSGNAEEAAQIFLNGAESFAENMIKEYDANGDGIIDKDEYVQYETNAYKELFTDTPDEEITSSCGQIFANLDLNGDGYIDCKEKVAQIVHADSSNLEVDGKIDPNEAAKIDWSSQDVHEQLTNIYKQLYG